MSILEVKGVRKVYVPRFGGSQVEALKNVTFSVEEGEYVSIMGESGSGKTTLILESLLPALEAAAAGSPLPAHVKGVEAGGITRAKLIDATPIGLNVRSTVATYANVHDELRKVFAKTPAAKALGYKAGDFSYNTGRLRCPTCDGTGSVSLDVQFLPDVDIPCPTCRGSRYEKKAHQVAYTAKDGAAAYTLPEIMAMDIQGALAACRDWKPIRQRLQVLADLGLGYLTLGEATPSLSGGEAQRLKLASEMGRGQADTLFVFDEPTIVIMFGDHQPSVEQGFLDLAYGVTQEQMTMEQYMGKYYVPFVIWANYPLPGTGPETTSLNFLGQYLLRYAGIAGTPYGDFLWQLQEELPALTFVGYVDQTGRAYSHLETNDFTARIEDYQRLQYNNLFGGQDRLAAFFDPEWFD